MWLESHSRRDSNGEEQDMKKKSYISTKFIILIPVFILGFVSVVSNILAVTNIRRVNANATQIANGYMNCISELGDIQKETLLIHRLGLSHIVATDLNTMISLVETIRSEQETLETYLDDFQEYVTDDNKTEYDALVSKFEGMKYELANLMAYSADNDNEAAYALANGKFVRLPEVPNCYIIACGHVTRQRTATGCCYSGKKQHRKVLYNGGLR